MPLDQKEFMAHHGVTEEDLQGAGLEWGELCAIHDDYLKYRGDLALPMSVMSDMLQAVDEVHSIRGRLKDPERLIKKVIRKKKEDPARLLTTETYRSEMTDLIGIRALHLFKADWGNIHDFIVRKWDPHETPEANVRDGDARDIIEAFEAKGCSIKVHPDGYRSVHYVVKHPMDKESTYLAEVQVRTIFEEGWSEIDHLLRYPDDMENSVIHDCLILLNRFAGSADEMGSFIASLRQEIRRQEDEHQQIVAERDRRITELQQQLDGLKINAAEKASLEEQVSQLKALIGPTPSRRWAEAAASLRGLGATGAMAELIAGEAAWRSRGFGAAGLMAGKERFARELGMLSRFDPRHETLLGTIGRRDAGAPAPPDAPRDGQPMPADDQET